MYVAYLEGGVGEADIFQSGWVSQVRNKGPNTRINSPRSSAMPIKARSSSNLHAGILIKGSGHRSSLVLNVDGALHPRPSKPKCGRASWKKWSALRRLLNPWHPRFWFPVKVTGAWFWFRLCGRTSLQRCCARIVGEITSGLFPPLGALFGERAGSVASRV